MKHGREILFYSVIAIFVVTAGVTLAGVTGLIQVEPRYLNVLFGTLIVELCAAVVGLFKATDWFGESPRPTWLTGGWWQLVRYEKENAISFVEITYSEGSKQHVLVGQAYTKEGEPFADWRSRAVAFDGQRQELRYFWKGDEEQQEDNFCGVGYFHFDPPSGNGRPEALGWFTTGNIDEGKVTGRPKVKFHPASGAHTEAMTSNAKTLQEKGKIAAAVYSEWAGA